MGTLNYPESGNKICLQLEDRSYWFRHRNNCIAALVRKFPPEGCILDIGGGNGFVAKRLLAEGFPVTLLEPGPVGAWNAKYVRNIPDVINAKFEDAAIKDESISAIGLFDVLEHIADEKEFLGQLWKVLKPDGLVYLTVPAHQWLWSYSDIHAGHFRRYNKNTIQALLGKRYTLKYLTYFFSVLLLPIFLFRVLPYRLIPHKNGSLLSNESEFGAKGGFSVKILNWFLNQEYRRVQAGMKLSLGTSCLIILEKINDKNSIQ